MTYILHDLKDPQLWEVWYIPYFNRSEQATESEVSHPSGTEVRYESHSTKIEPPVFPYSG